jgi:hypothetical protein
MIFSFDPAYADSPDLPLAIAQLQQIFETAENGGQLYQRCRGAFAVFLPPGFETRNDTPG